MITTPITISKKTSKWLEALREYYGLKTKGEVVDKLCKAIGDVMND